MTVTPALARPLAPLTQPVLRWAGAALRWPTESQLHSRRNALVASTALARRRAELDDVEEYLTSLASRRRAAAVEAATSAAL